LENRREKLVKLLENALKPIIEPLGASIDSVESFEIDPYGPRIVLQLSPGNGVVSIFIDASPDGVEAVYTLRVDKGLDKQSFEEELSTLIEESEEFRGVEEYDVTYTPEEGEVTITLRARMIAELPGISEVRKAVESAAAKTSTPR
jgi:hypothetical protein